MVNVILTWWSEAVLTQSVLSGIISSLSAFAVVWVFSANCCLVPGCYWIVPYNCW